MDMDFKLLPLMIHPFDFFKCRASYGGNNFKPERVEGAIDHMVIVLRGNDPKFHRVADAPRGATCRRRWKTSSTVTSARIAS